MAKGTRGRRGIASRQCRSTPYPLPSYDETDGIQKNCSKMFKEDWEDATCSVCMECPHNAVLLLCSSHEKGCRPYMCGTSFRHSNCLDQYKKAYTKVTVLDNHPFHDPFETQATGPFSGSCKAQELACPLCRGQVKGWTVVEPARDHLNAKRRNCMQDNCPFIGTYKELRKHVRAEHPCAKPREVDPTLEQKWRRLEGERERDDVLSTIRSSMPGAMFFGDYVIDGNQQEIDSDDEEVRIEAFDRNGAMAAGMDRSIMSVFLLLQSFGSAGNAVPFRGQTLGGSGTRSGLDNTEAEFAEINHDSSDDDNEDEGNYGNSVANRLSHHGGGVVGRSRRRRRRQASGGGDSS